MNFKLLPRILRAVISVTTSSAISLGALPQWLRIYTGSVK